MQLEDKVKKSLEFIKESADGKYPILLCSFGKDSMVLLHLIRQIMDIPVIFYKVHNQQERYEFAQQIIRDWHLTVYDYPPLLNDIIYKDEKMNGVGTYWLGGEVINKVLWLTKPNGRFSCAIEDILTRPTCDGYKFKWDCVFSAHKKIDVDLLLGKLELKGNKKGIVHYPLLDWDNKDIWEYIRVNDIPYNAMKYDANGNVLTDTTYNENYHAACIKCLDPNEAENVYCEREKKEVQNMGKLIDYEKRLKAYTEPLKEYMEMEE